MDELKPCPFCGEEARLDISEEKSCETTYDIDCYGKGCFRPINNFPFESKEQAIKAWNRRIGSAKDSAAG